MTKDVATRRAKAISMIRLKQLQLTRYLRKNYGLPEQIRKSRVDRKYQHTIEFKEFKENGGHKKYKKSLWEAKNEADMELLNYINKVCTELALRKDRVLQVMGGAYVY